ncbi:MAG: leucine-rich repeat protein [Clostridiales bacterium]|jgi:hypothetical protein|nr:leucine-rich repeat protein [Clostridiales bacterium]
MNTKKFVLIVSLLMLVTLVAPASHSIEIRANQTAGNILTYRLSISSSNATITACDKTATIVQVQAGFTEISRLGYSIVSIGADAFEDCVNLTALTLPNTIENIGVRAFWGSKIKSVTLPASLTTTSSYGDEGPFANTPLEEVTFADGTKEIPSNVLLGTENVTKINDGNGVCVLPNTIEKIGYRAFWGTKIKSVTLPASLTTTVSYGDEGPFANTPLEEVIFADGTKEIPSDVLLGAENVTKINDDNGVCVLPDTIEKIGLRAFWDTKIKSVTLPASLTTTVSSGGDEGQGPFANTPLEEVIFADGTKEIPAYILLGAENVTKINDDNGV